MTIEERIFNIATQQEFRDLALIIFKHQFENNSVYRSFCDLLYKNPADVKSISEIPFLPISFFKTHHIVSTKKQPTHVFKSSGTTTAITSKHYVSDIGLYETSFIKGFETQYGAIDDYVVLALLPSYLEREGSSLVYMADHFIKQSKCPDSGFYLDDFAKLHQTLTRLEQAGKKTLLLGVTFALLDFIEQHPIALNHTVIMETGGMKGRRKELIREELHQKLKTGFGVEHIHSEYGMTELLSQAYSLKNGLFQPPKWMRVFSRDTEDALSLLNSTQTGGLTIIDLANYNSCSFIATQDLGKVYPDGTFEVLGRFDNSDIRGCSLLSL